MSVPGILGRLRLVLLVAVLATGAAAQVSAPDPAYYDQWRATAERAETVIDAGRASNAAFEQLRAEIVAFRETFLAARDQNSSRIRTLQSQLQALGPAPEGDTEPADIAARRASLTAELDQLRVPGVVAEEAYNRANGLVGEIDRIIRERQTGKLIARGPTPLNPALWPAAWRDLARASRGLVNETVSGAAAGATRERIKQNFPLILALAAIGAVLVLRGGRWSERLGEYLRGFGGTGTGVWGFVVSLTKIFLPLAGVVVLVQAVSFTAVLGLRGTLLLAAIPYWAAIFLVFNWLGYQLYSDRGGAPLVVLDPGRQRLARLLVALLATLLIVYDAIGLYERIENLSQGSRAVAGFVPVLLSALILLRLQRIGLGERPAAEPQDTDAPRRSGWQNTLPLLRRATALLAVLAPILAGIGYVFAAEALIYPLVLTIAVIAGVLILQRFFVDLYAWLSAKGEAARDSLVSALIGLVLALAALPVLALVWGARVTDLTELWAKFLEGFQIGDTRISPTDFVAFAAIFAIGYTVTRLVQSGLRNNLLPKTAIDPGGQNAIVAGTGYVGIFLAAVLAITGAGLDLSSLAIVAGALSVGIGFGLQTIVSNFVSGIILLVERPISKGDWIEVGGQMGYVRDISVRATRIETFDRTDVIVPNSDLISGTVTNYTRGNTIGRVIVSVGVAYGTDTRKVETILREIAQAHPMVLANPAPGVVFQGFGADSMDFEIRAILRDVNWSLSVRSDMNHEIARRFAEEGVEIPYAQRDIWIRNPEALAGMGENPSQDPQTGEAT